MFDNKKKYIAALPVLILFLLVLCPTKLAAETVAVIYPNIREPYLSVFKEIIKGIGFSVKKVKKYRLEKDTTTEELILWLQKKQITTVIALGKSGLKYARTLPDNISITVGAILLPPSGNAMDFSGITLSPSPEQLFSQLRKFSSDIETITVIYNKKHNDWLIEHAKNAAKSLNFTLRVIPAANLAESANLYREVLQEPLDNTHAIWLLQDKLIIDSKAMLPTILNRAWDKKFIVFSSNPAYVKRGILFSLFPDNKEMGKSLGMLAAEAGNKTDKNNRFLPLSNLKIAVNIRAAEHLGLDVRNSDRRDFDLIFPPQR